MRPALPFPGKRLPLRCEGAISLRDGWALGVKSPRSALLFLVVWAAARLTGLWGRNLVVMTEVLRGWDVLGVAETVHGFLVFTPPDPRGRSYVVVHTETCSLFAKVGTDVPNETISDDLAERLEAEGFQAYLPLAHRTDGTGRANIYTYLRSEHYNKFRFSAAQAKQFSEALNQGTAAKHEALKTVLERTPRHPRAADVFHRPEVVALCSKLAQVPVAMGRCHGDLMSPNMLCRKDGRLPVIILDWESHESTAPLVLDRIGGRDWADVVQQANDALGLSTPSAAEALIFMVIAGSRGFRPALDWLNQI